MSPRRAAKLAESVPHRYAGPAGLHRCRECGGVLLDGTQPREGRFYCGDECWDVACVEAGERMRPARYAWRYEVLMPEVWIPGPHTKHRPKMVAVWQGESLERAMVEARDRAYAFTRPVTVELWDRSIQQPQGTYKGRRAHEVGTLVWDETP